MSKLLLFLCIMEMLLQSASAATQEAICNFVLLQKKKRKEKENTRCNKYANKWNMIHISKLHIFFTINENCLILFEFIHIKLIITPHLKLKRDNSTC